MQAPPSRVWGAWWLKVTSIPWWSAMDEQTTMDTLDQPASPLALDTGSNLCEYWGEAEGLNCCFCSNLYPASDSWREHVHEMACLCCTALSEPWILSKRKKCQEFNYMKWRNLKSTLSRCHVVLLVTWPQHRSIVLHKSYTCPMSMWLVCLSVHWSRACCGRVLHLLDVMSSAADRREFFIKNAVEFWVRDLVWNYTSGNTNAGGSSGKQTGCKTC